jgi:3-phenylpropionate/trans-cinnamate dioxygenase ferredoxin component
VSGGAPVDLGTPGSWIPVAPAASIPPGDSATVEIDRQLVAVFNIDGEYLAGEVIVCPRHGARFSLRTGAVLGPPAYEPVRTYQTRVAEGMVEVRGA